MELLDALCSDHRAQSVVELSLTPAFRAHYSTIFHAIDELTLSSTQLRQFASFDAPRPRALPCWVFAVDVTPCPRPYARTLKERAYVYQTTPTPGQKPIAVGHQYSSTVLLPEPEDGVGSWVVPVATKRCAYGKDKELVGIEETNAALNDERMKWFGELTMMVGDTSYSKPAAVDAYLSDESDVIGGNDKRLLLTRLRSNRVVFDPPPANSRRWYGERFALNDPMTWRPADVTETFTQITAKGKRLTVTAQAWFDMRIRGHRKPKRLPMHTYPFTLIRITVRDEYGRDVFKNSLWLSLFGQKRADLSLEQTYTAYTRRARIEQFFRFSKQHLLLHRFQTAELERAEAWWTLSHLAYTQLWQARHLVRSLPRPWEKYLPMMKQRLSTPRTVQRGFERLIQQLGTPARPPKPRNRSSGRRPGQGRRRRIRYQFP